MSADTFWVIEQYEDGPLLLGTRSDGRVVLPVFSTRERAVDYLSHLGASSHEIVRLTGKALAEVMWFGNTYFGVTLYAPDGEWAQERHCRDFIRQQGFVAYSDVGETNGSTHQVPRMRQRQVAARK